MNTVPCRRAETSSSERQLKTTHTHKCQHECVEVARLRFLDGQVFASVITHGVTVIQLASWQLITAHDTVM